MSIHRVNILRSDSGDCTNNGVTSPDMAKGRAFFVITDPADEEKVESNWVNVGERGPKPVCLLLVSRRFGLTPYLHVTPTTIRGHGMMGGNFVWSCDSRFREISQYPLAVHDRVE